MADWLEIVIPAPAGACDDAAARLADELPDARAGVEIRSGEIVFWVDLERGEAALDAAKQAVSRLADAGVPVDPSRVRSQPAMAEDEWKDAWKKYFHTIKLTRQIVVVPSWDRHTPEPGDIPIHLDPGQAFGTGAHATTQLMLEELQSLADSGEQVHRVLDVGTGSGILAIAAMKLWPAATAIAIDIDSLAIGATIENAEANGVGDRITCSATPVEAVDGEFDLVLANIQANVLHALCAPVCARTSPEGRVVLSGLLTPQAAGVAETFSDALGWPSAVRASTHDPEWSVATLAADRTAPQ